MAWTQQLLKVKRPLCEGHEPWDGPSAVVPSLRVEGAIMLPVWEPIQAKERLQAPHAPKQTHTHPTAAKVQGSALSLDPFGVSFIPDWLS